MTPQQFREQSWRWFQRTAAATAVAACGATAEPSKPADAGPDAPSWCAPLLPYQEACHVDPVAACTEHNGTAPEQAFDCGEPSPASPQCVGFTPTDCTVEVYCCSATD